MRDLLAYILNMYRNLA